MTHHTSQQINLRGILRVVGGLLLVESVFMLIPIVTAMVYCEYAELRAYLCSLIITAGMGVLIMKIFGAHVIELTRRDGILLTAMVWVVFSLFGMLPFLLGQSDISVIDAFLEAMAGFTTTGITSSSWEYTHAHIIWTCVMQWIGGLGIILFTLAVIPMLNHSAGLMMFNAEMTTMARHKLRPRVSQTAKGLWGVYLSMTLICMILLAVGPMSVFESLCYALATVSTGGCGVVDRLFPIYELPMFSSCVVMLFMLLGGVSFALIFRAAHGDVKALTSSSVLKFYMSIFVIASGVSLIICGILPTFKEGLAVVFQTISMMTTTGYAVESPANSTSFYLILCLLLMSIGGCAGSTSGGAKMDRLYCMLQMARSEIRRSLMPNTICAVRLDGGCLQTEVVTRSLTYLCMYAMVALLGALALSLSGISSAADAVWVSLACLSNTGVAPADNPDIFINSSISAKTIMTLLMPIGRLEIYVILALILPSFWRK